MRNKQEFEERVYELYKLKKQKRLSYMKRFTVVGTAVLAAACVIFVFTRFGNNKISDNPMQKYHTEATNEEVATGDREEMNGMDGMDGIGNSPITNETNAEEDNAEEEDGNSLRLLGATIRKYPSEETAELNEEEAEEFMKFVREMNVTNNFQVEESVSENFYEIEFDYGYEVVKVVYRDGLRQIDDGDWMKCNEEDATELESILEEIFRED